MARTRIKIPARFGPEWWACYAAAFAVERAAFERTEVASGHDEYDRVRRIRSSIAERCVTIADDAIAGFREARDGGCICSDDDAGDLGT